MLEFMLPLSHSNQSSFLLSPTSEKYCSIVYEQISSPNEKLKVSISDGAYLYSFNESPIAIFYWLFPQGYAILDYQNGIVLEYSLDANNPFFEEKDQQYYYNGVLNYYCKTRDNEFLSLTTKHIVNAKSCHINSAYDFYKDGKISPQTKGTEGPVTLIHSTRPYNCNYRPNFSYFYPSFSQNELNEVPGVCGSLACAVIVAYLDDFKTSMAGTGDFADNQKKLRGIYSDNTYGIELVKEFINYIEPNGNGSFFLNPGFSSYLRDHGIDGGCTVSLLDAYGKTKKSISSDGSGIPIFIGTRDHYCVGIGYKNNSVKQIYVNYGHGYNSWLNADTVVSTWTVFIN